MAGTPWVTFTATHGTTSSKDSSTASWMAALLRRTGSAMAALLAEPLTASTLRRREVLRRLDIVGLRLSEAADHHATAAIKRWT